VNKLNPKKLAGETAARFVKDGMVVGLGTGSTVYYTLVKLGDMIQNEGLSIKGVTTSSFTTAIAKELGIPLVDIDSVDKLDITIDGADEIDENYNGIKGGGGALFFEKIVAKASNYIVWVVDSSKMVKVLGSFPLPVEVLPFGYSHVKSAIESKGITVELRKKDGRNVVTDSGNFILDLYVNKIVNIEELNEFLNNLTGVLEHGLFIKTADTIIVATEESTQIIHTEFNNK